MPLFEVGIDELDDVLEIKTSVMAIFKQGGSVFTTATSDNISVTKSQGISLAVLKAECNDFLKRSPDSEFYQRPIRRLRPFYT